MFRLTVALLAVALAGSASAGGWRSLRVDGSSEAAFATSVAAFEDQLPAARYQVLLMALKDVWELGTKNAEAAQSEYTDTDYLRQIDGLTYEQLVTVTDPTGDTAKTRLRAATARLTRPIHDGYVRSTPTQGPANGYRGGTPQQIATGSWRADCGCGN